jgi:hypothetical protein
MSAAEIMKGIAIDALWRLSAGRGAGRWLGGGRKRRVSGGAPRGSRAPRAREQRHFPPPSLPRPARAPPPPRRRRLRGAAASAAHRIFGPRTLHGEVTRRRDEEREVRRGLGRRRLAGVGACLPSFSGPDPAKTWRGTPLVDALSSREYFDSVALNDDSSLNPIVISLGTFVVVNSADAATINAADCNRDDWRGGRHHKRARQSRPNAA